MLHQLRQLQLLPLHDGSITSLAAPPRGLPVFFPPSVAASASSQAGGSSSTSSALQACGLTGPLQGVTYLAEELLQVGNPAAAAAAAAALATARYCWWHALCACGASLVGMAGAVSACWCGRVVMVPYQI